MYYFYFSSVLGCCGCKNMATQNSGKSILIVPYEWKLENVEKDFKTIVSNMILFRGEKVFRAALKKSDKEQWTLVFLAINLNKIGLQVSDVACGKEGADTNCKMKEYIPDKNKVKGDVDEGNLQLFTCNVDIVFAEIFTFVFQIHLEGIVAGYSYNLRDRLGKDQLWSTVNNKLHADIEFIVQDKRFSAHKAILAARSPEFRSDFTKEKSKNVNQIRIDDVDASSFEQFLYFLYTGEFLHLDFTGEPAPMLVNKDLLKLASRYQLKTLKSLCRVALREVNAEQMVSFKANLNSSSDGQETNFKSR